MVCSSSGRNRFATDRRIITNEHSPKEPPHPTPICVAAILAVCIAGLCCLPQHSIRFPPQVGHQTVKMSVMNLYVKDTECSVHFVEVSIDGTVEDIRLSSARAMNVDAHLLRLLLNDEVLDPQDLICDTSIANEDVLFAETVTPFRFVSCGEAAEIMQGGMQFHLVRQRPDYAVAMLHPPIHAGEDSTWAILIKGSPRIDFGVTCNPHICLNEHCRNNRNHIWHITGLTRTSCSTYLCIYGDEQAGTVPYDPQKGVVVQMSLKYTNGEGSLTCEFQDVITRAVIHCFPQAITGITSTAYPIWCLDDPSVAEVVMPSTRD